MTMKWDILMTTGDIVTTKRHIVCQSLFSEFLCYCFGGY